MNKLFLTVAVLAALSVSLCQAQAPVSARVEPQNVTRTSKTADSESESTRAWTASYPQESARDYIRRRAQEKAEARRARIEAMRWLGHSPLRPTVNATPFMSHPPMWTASQPWFNPSGNLYWYHALNLGVPATLP